MTKLKYLDDTYLFTLEATVLEMRENEKGKALILDETIFYPQGGGQPADTGKIYSDEAVFLVKDTRLDEEGTAWHFGEFESGTFNKGDKVKLEIDKDRRIINSKIHSAGHLIDCAVEKLKIIGLEPTKGFHFPDGPYVEYDGEIENPVELIPRLQKTVDELISANLMVEKEDLSPEEAEKRNIWAPQGKSARIVNFSGFGGCGCGGTHVRSSGEIGKITIRKIKSKEGLTKISYSTD